jgi:predicted transcriptional regulator
MGKYDKPAGKQQFNTQRLRPLQKGVVQMEERRACVSALYCEGKGIREIAETFGVTAATITADLKEIRRDWLQRSIEHYDQRKAEELAKIDRLEAEAWEAWHRSCANLSVERTRTESVRLVPPKQKKTVKKPKHTMVPIRTSTEVTIKGQTGDPRFLEQVAWCIETRLKVMGALKPDTSNVTVNQINWAEMVVAPPSQNSIEDTIEQARLRSRVTPALSDRNVIDERKPDPEE